MSKSFSPSTPSSLALRQEGYRYCVSQPVGTCIIAYIVNPQASLPLEILLISNDCEMAMGGARNLARDASPVGMQTASLVTSPVTVFTVEYQTDDLPAEIKANGTNVDWTMANSTVSSGRTIWTGTFSCHLKKPQPGEG
ncbi:hypothetical protein NHQ30_009451 [Ciborinia camelliae]|nr:hypothetical protein NHQ30_009451 [Ciborinia camelliae]